MNLIDSSAWLEYFNDDLNAAFFTDPIENTTQVIVPAICLYEVFKKFMQKDQKDAGLKAISYMCRGRVVSLDPELALQAAKTSVELKLSMADSIIYATARQHNAIIWTQDIHFKNLPGVKYIGKK